MAAVLLTAAPLSASAFAADAPTTPAATAAERSRAEVRVGTFLHDYRQAVLHKGDRTPAQVRAHYLTHELDRRLGTWARLHDADPVFRAQNVPASWSTRTEGSGAGHTTVIVTEHWRGGAKRDVWYQVRLEDLTISDLEDPPA